MNRTINIVSDIARVQIPNADSIDLSKIDSIINCSIDTIFLYIVEYIKPEHVKHILLSLLEKLRPEGNIIIRFADLKKICELYNKNEITDGEFFAYVQNKNNILSIDFIMTIISDKFVITKIDYIDNHIITIIQRKSL